MESIPALLKRFRIRALSTYVGGIDSFESIPGLLKRLQIRSLATKAVGIDFLESIPWNRFLGSYKRLKIGLYAEIFKLPIGARNRVGIGLPYWPARLHRLAELIPWNQFLGSLKV